MTYIPNSYPVPRDLYSYPIGLTQFSLNSNLKNDISPFLMQKEHLQTGYVLLFFLLRYLKVRSQPEWDQVFFVWNLERHFY